jgi:hypothetical protein
VSIRTEFFNIDSAGSEIVHKPKFTLAETDTKVSQQRKHIPTWLSLDLSNELDQLVNHLHAQLTVDTENPVCCFEKFQLSLSQAKPEHLPMAIYFLMADSSTRDSLVKFLLIHPFKNFSFHETIRTILFGTHNQEILRTVYGPESSLRINELRGVCQTFLGEILGEVATTWNKLSLGKCTYVSTIPQWIKQSIYWVKCVYEVQDCVNITPSGLVNFLVENYRQTLINLALYPKSRLLQDKNYLLFHQPIIHLLCNHSRGVELFRDIMARYVHNESWDNKFLNHILFTDILPCDQQANTSYLDKVFSEEYVLTQECRDFVLKAGTCLVPMIERIVNTPPPFSTRYSWQTDIEQIFLNSSNKELYEKHKDHFAWAFHFSQVPSDMYKILDHHLNFDFVFSNFVDSDLINDFGTFSAIFNLLSIQPKYLMQLVKIKPKMVKKLLVNNFIDLCKSYLMPVLPSSTRKIMRFNYPCVNVEQILQKNTRRMNDFVDIIIHSKESFALTEMLTIFLKVQRNYSFADKQHILYQFLKGTINRTNMPMIKLFQLLTEEELSLFVSYMWQEKYLDKPLYDRLFNPRSRDQLFPPYKKFIQAIDSLEENDQIRIKLDITDHEQPNSRVLYLVAQSTDASARDCSIQ